MGVGLRPTKTLLQLERIFNTPPEISMEIRDGKTSALPSVMGPNTRRRTAEKNHLTEAQTSSSAVSITTDGWNLKDHNHLTVALHLREKTHLSLWL